MQNLIDPAILFFVFGVFAGSMLWWVILSVAVSTLKQKFVDGGLLLLNRVSGAVITLSGLAVMVTVTWWWQFARFPRKVPRTRSTTRTGSGRMPTG